MKKFIHTHSAIVIGTLVAVFAAILITFYFWAIGDVFAEIDRALAPPPAQTFGGFDLAGASKLDLHGLVNTSTPSTE